MPTFPLVRANAPQRRIRGKSLLQKSVTVKASVGVHNFTISDTIVNSLGVPVVGATVKLFRTGNDCLVAQTVTDVLGSYSFTISDNAGNFYVVAYLAGTPDTFGTSVNTLTLV